MGHLCIGQKVFFAAHDKYQKVCTLHKPAFWLRIPPYERTAPQKTPFRLRISPYEWNAQVNFLPPTTNTKKSALSAKTPFELISYYMNVLYCKNRRRRFLPKLILRGFAAYHKVRTLRKNACGVFAQVNFLSSTTKNLLVVASHHIPLSRQTQNKALKLDVRLRDLAGKMRGDVYSVYRFGVYSLTVCL